MNFQSFPFRARTMILLAVLFCSVTLRAVTPSLETRTVTVGEPAVGLQRISHPQGERLAQAYHMLAKADKDYDGHLDKAMKCVEKAAKILGVDVHADGIVDKKEGDSDEHLRTAQEMLRLAKAALPVNGEKKALVNVGAAMREITAALKKK